MRLRITEAINRFNHIENKNWRMIDLCRAIYGENHTHYKYIYLRSIDKGKTRFDSVVLNAICDALKCSADYLIGRE